MLHCPTAINGFQGKDILSVAGSFSDIRRRNAARLLLIGVAFAAGAVATYPVLRAVFGDRPAHINVRWSPATTSDVQHRLEQQCHLTYGHYHDGVLPRQMAAPIPLRSVFIHPGDSMVSVVRARATAPACAASVLSAATMPRVDIVIERVCERLILTGRNRC